MSWKQERAELAAAPEEKNSASARPSDVAEKGGKTRAPPPVQSPQSHEVKKDEEEDRDLKAPLDLLIKFLAAVTDRDFESAHQLCQMILIYEPDNPEASEFLPLIHRKLLEGESPYTCTHTQANCTPSKHTDRLPFPPEREAEQSCEEDDGKKDDCDDDDDDDSGSSSHSSPSSDDDDVVEEEEMCMNGHEPCPPS
uniref:glutamate-rich protein 2 isoform X1 n=1 Tax=Solea senegalensis TaxID=28829 RepID=UPI001CD90276|nr:glutamate-rich protein 2 isoform X1 [Solea senegalensis]